MKYRIYNKWHTFLFVSLLSIFLIAPFSAFAGIYSFKTIDYPGSIWTYVFGINDDGQVVGYHYNGMKQFGFLEYNGNFADIVFPDSWSTDAYGINNLGHVIGRYIKLNVYGFIKTGGSYTSFSHPEAIPWPPYVSETQAFGINDNGTIVGRYGDKGNIRGFIKDGMTYAPIDYPGAYFTEPRGINNSGVVVGRYWHFTSFGFIFSNGIYDYIVIPGSSETSAYDINDHGTIVGSYKDDSGTHGYLLDDDFFETIDFPGAKATCITSINNNGQMAGTYWDESSKPHGFVALPTTLEVMIDVQPDDELNRVNLKSRGIIPVAILTTDDFDTTTIDSLSVAFGSHGAMEAHGEGHIEDVDYDGDLDLLLHFRTQETGIACGDEEVGLTGETFDGQAIEGFDVINTAGCN